MTGWCEKKKYAVFILLPALRPWDFTEKMGAVRDGETRSPVDGRPVPHFVYDV